MVSSRAPDETILVKIKEARLKASQVDLEIHCAAEARSLANDQKEKKKSTKLRINCSIQKIHLN